MPGPPQKISILLAGGVDNRSETEFVQPIAAQGTQVKLRASTNTRLSVRPGGVVRSPKFTAVANATADARGITQVGVPRSILASSASSRSTVAVTPGADNDTEPQFYLDAGRVGNGAGLFSSGRPSNSSDQRAVNHVRIADAGVVSQRRAMGHVAMCYNSTLDQRWTAYFEADTVFSTGIPNGYYSYISVTDADGVPLAGTRQFVAGTYASAPLWTGLTAHGANGVILWILSQAGNISASKLSVAADSSISFSSAAPAVVSNSAAPVYGIDVCSGGDSYAYLVCSKTASLGTASIIQWNAVTNAVVTTVTAANAMLGGGQVAISSEVIRGTRYVGVAMGSITSGATTMNMYSASLVLSWTTTKPIQGPVGVGFVDCSTSPAPRALFLVNPVSGSFAAGTAGTVTVYVQPYEKVLSTGADAGSSGNTLPWRTLQSHVAQWSPTATTTFPVFATGPTYGATGTEVGGVNYADDPSIEIHVFGNYSVAGTVVARVGVVRGIQSPARLQTESMLSSKALAFSGQQAHFVYRQSSDLPSIGVGILGSPPRYVVLDFSPSQPSVAHDRDGAALISGALPLQWDGRELFEISGVLHTPHVYFLSGIGTLAAGVYSMRAVLRWQDSSGQMHRSRPSAITSYTSPGGAGTGGRAYVSAQNILGSVYMDALVYLSEPNGKTQHLMGVGSARNGIGVADSVQVTAANPMVYTTEAIGTELAPQPPPPAHDIAIVGSRCWILDAEVRGRWVHSKYRIAGIGYEFHPALEVIIPSSAGKGYACREWNGLPVFLCENGVYQTSGDGPTNTGQGSPYAPPVKVSDYGCTNTASVATFPGGIIWQFGERFVTLNENGVRLVPDFACTHDVSCAVVATRHSEVLFFSATTAEVRVYNYEVGRWTTWDSETLPDPVTQASLLPYDPDTVLVYSQTTGITRRLDVDSISAAAHMTIETDWCLLGGDFQDHVELRDLVFSAYANGPHGIEIAVYTDYNDTTPTTSVSWSEAEITALTVNSRYTLRVDPVQPNCRAMRIRVRDVVAAGVNTQGMGPRALTVSYQLNGQLFEDSFLQNSNKGTSTP